MDRFGLIGYPIAHSLSPELFRKAYGGRWEYELIEEQDFDRAWERFCDGPYKAVNVTAPFKTEAAMRADIKSPEVLKTGAANILLKTDMGIKAFNSDYLGLIGLLPDSAGKTAAVIGMGGAGRAAAAAAADKGFKLSTFHHDGISEGVEADLIIYTLPCRVPGADRLISHILIEANYKDPCLEGHEGYIPGTDWLKAQADAGFFIMTGEKPEKFFILQNI